MNECDIVVLPEGVILKAARGAILADVLRNSEFPIRLDCRLRGVCGKCLVEIIRGDAAEPDETERYLIRNRQAGGRFRLACRCRIQGPLIVRIPRESLLLSIPALTEGFRREFILDPPLRKFAAAPAAATLAEPEAVLDLIVSRFGDTKTRISPAALTRLAASGSSAERTITVIMHGNEILDIEPDDTTERILGLAVDLGTTTVVAEVVDLLTGRSLAAATALNGQARFGSDVVSRISAAQLNAAALGELRDAARETINLLMAELLARIGALRSDIYEAVIAGNTAMTHLLLGLPVATLAVAPFQSLFSALPALPADRTGIRINPAGRVYLAPNIKSFVGGDISAGLTAVDIESGPGSLLFIDLGTNGELVLKHGGILLTTSTAAGPAFEGMSLSCGMIAAPGAVHRADFVDELALGTIGGGPAVGVCGSGLIDLLAIALDQGWMTAAGSISNPAKVIVISPAIGLFQKDIREIQLAAAAIKTGIKRLLAEAGLSPADLDKIVVAGAFGNTLNFRNAARLGLIPSVAENKIDFVGNSSLAGARIFLLSAAERDRCEALVRRIRHVSLAQGPAFEDAFVESLEFKPWK
jgi:uncharacterized 2Fe-2S/4Fe-4S cluster protein (DUF4445 family)